MRDFGFGGRLSPPFADGSFLGALAIPFPDNFLSKVRFRFTRFP